ncbi:uncharacterized protein BDZ83DRAFT_651293 [Colletotrichum acutatum]|uniref:Zn(2)-C6 fungal-type domain-containing protein n=1 Tax=Glomerella acutata TaxID=27357 RepID=A0AAD8US70_GLOAC|nr:uncharacterized protein BDZ83DRAFT_651293 [Colletotrichum acutatum]KAK1725455.1 hypothetical protein BDZ83DRAFT_651293 [Colletotrichum acutatum]
MPPPRTRQTRQSCDRCHAHKLRCPKQPGNAICSRCLKAGAACVYSPVGTLPAYQDLAAEPSDDVLPLSNGATDLGWGNFSFDDILGFSSVQPCDVASSRLGQAPLIQVPADPRSQCFEQLTAITATLDRATTGLPPIDKFHVSGPDSKRYCLEISQQYSHKESLELLLAETQKLVDVYPKAVQFALERRPSPDCSVPNCIHTYQSITGLQDEPFANSAQLTSKIDYPLLNLLLCCHYRCADVMELVLCHVQLCLRFLAAAMQQDVQPHEFDVPELKIGSFTPSRRSSPSIIMAILIDLQSSLASCVPRLSSALKEREGDCGKEGRILLLQCELLAERGNSIVDRLKKLRDTLSNAGLLA